MENSSFNTVVVRDSRIQDISSKLDVILQKGPAQSTYQQFSEQAENQNTPTSVSFNVVVPSENIVIDREITWSGTVKFQITCPLNKVGIGNLVMSYGETEALTQFPLNSLLTNAMVTINTASISVPTQDIMHCLLRTTEDESLSKYKCPHMSDKKFKKYSDMILSQSNALGSLEKSKGNVLPRGAHPVKIIVKRYVAGTLTNTATLNQVGTANSTSAEMVTALTSSATATNSWVIDVEYDSTEPLLFMSPFVYGENYNNSAGLYGVSNMNFVFNIDSSAKRMFCSGSAHADDLSISLTSITKNKLNLQFLTCQASDLLATKNVVPYVEYQRFLTTQKDILASGASIQITSSAIPLNQIPNRILICVRKSLNSSKMKDSNTFLKITNLNVNFNNQSGILSGAQPEDLYNMSKRNGSKQDMHEFMGYASGVNGHQYSSSGSLIVINPATDLNLPDYLSNNSGGQFSLQFTVNVINTDADLYPELVIISEMNGLFITQSGQSTKITSLFTKDIVMNSTMNQFGESSRYISSFGKDNGLNLCSSGLKNVPLLNTKKASAPAPVSGGAFSGGVYF